MRNQGSCLVKTKVARACFSPLLPQSFSDELPRTGSWIAQGHPLLPGATRVKSQSLEVGAVRAFWAQHRTARPAA